MTSLITIDKVKTNEEKYMNEIITSKGSNLPANIEDVINVFEFTDFKAKAWKIMADKMSKLEEQSDLHQSALRSAQQWSASSLYSQKRMGEITREMPTKANKFRHDLTIEPKQKKLKSKGISERTYSDAEQLAKHPEILDDVIETAKKRNEVPTKTAVLGRIRAEKRKKINEKAKSKSEKKVAEEKTQAVKDYYDVLKGFKAGISSAIISAKHGDFSPEGKNFLVKKHNEIKKLLTELEDII